MVNLTPQQKAALNALLEETTDSLEAAHQAYNDCGHDTAAWPAVLQQEGRFDGAVSVLKVLGVERTPL